MTVSDLPHTAPVAPYLPTYRPMPLAHDMRWRTARAEQSRATQSRACSVGSAFPALASLACARELARPGLHVTVRRGDGESTALVTVGGHGGREALRAERGGRAVPDGAVPPIRQGQGTLIAPNANTQHRKAVRRLTTLWAGRRIGYGVSRAEAATPCAMHSHLTRPQAHAHTRTGSVHTRECTQKHLPTYISQAQPEC